MPRRKITIEQAMRVLDESNIEVIVTGVKENPKPPQKVTKPRASSKVMLYSQHRICNDVYGPGESLVPEKHLRQVMYQEYQAKQYEANLRSTEPKYYIVGRVEGNDGRVSFRGIRVSEDVLNGNFNPSKFPSNLLIQL